MKVNIILIICCGCCCFIPTGLCEVNSAEISERRSFTAGPHRHAAIRVEPELVESENVIIQPISQIREMIDNTEAMKKGLYVLITLSLSVLLYICYRSVKLRKTRAERRYGVQGDRTSHEMRPLPLANEDDSENENTLFNREVHMVA